MHPLAQLTRTDVLLALALFSVRDETNGSTDETARALAALTAMEPSARAALERRAAWYEQLSPTRRREWVDHKLHLVARSRWELDETIHPSHIAQRLREEPAYVQRLLLARLPAATRRAVRAALGRPEAEGDHIVEEDASADLAAVVWSAFLRHFVSLFDLARQTPVDRLSGVELARLIHLLGTRETALACRSVPEVETVAAFLRRFAAEDARVITAHLAKLVNVELPRVLLAEKTVRESLLAEPEPSAMLYRAGLRTLAIALAELSGEHVQYAAQKLPVEAAGWLRQAVDEVRAQAIADEIKQAIVAEVDSLANGIQRAARGGRGERAQSADDAS